MGIQYQQNILTPFQEEALKSFFEYEELQAFYLTGGTVLAIFYLHHRLSEDLDFFTHQDFDPLLLERMSMDLAAKKGWQISSTRKELYLTQFLLKENEQSIPLKIDFVKDIAVHFGETEKWGKVRVDSLRNISSNKICAIFGRTTVKDFVDFYFLMKQEKIPLDEIFKEAQEKDGGLNELYFAGQLRNVSTFKSLPQMIKPLTLPELQSFILKLADEFIDRARPF